MAASFEPLPSPSSFRKLAAAMWGRPNDPTIYGVMDLDARPVLATVERLRAEGTKVTVTHVVVRAIALALQKHPELNAKVRFWGKLEQRRTVDIFVQVTADNGKDLSGARIEACDKLDLAGIAGAVSGAAKQIRGGDDASYAKSRDLLRSLPWWLVRLFVRTSDFLVNELHWNLPKFGMPRDPFGSAMVTSVGMFGIDTAFAPFTPIARCPIILLVPEVRDRPWVEDGAVVVRPILRICATFDHRIIDGFHAGVLAREVSALLKDPSLLG